MLKPIKNSKMNDPFKKRCNILRNKKPILNISGVSYYNGKNISINNISKSQKTDNKGYNLSMKSLNQNNIFDSKNNNNSNFFNNEGIICYNKTKIIIPKLIIPQANLSKNLTERKIYLSPIKHKSRITDRFYDTKRMKELFDNKEENKQKVNEVLKIKKGNNNFHNIINERKENKIFEQLLKELGINKYTDDKVLKKIRVGMIDKKNYLKNKNLIKKRRLRNLNKFKDGFLYKRNSSLKYFEENSYINMNFYNKYHPYSSAVINNNGLSKNNVVKEKSKDINHYQSMNIKNISYKIKMITKEFKNIDNKLKESFNKVREQFENEIDKELDHSDYIK